MAPVGSKVTQGDEDKPPLVHTGMRQVEVIITGLSAEINNVNIKDTGLVAD
jgi:hypothetical protein